MSPTSASALAQLDSLRDTLTKDQIDSDPVTRQKACLQARKLWLELEEPGDLIDRIIYQVKGPKTIYPGWIEFHEV